LALNARQKKTALLMATILSATGAIAWRMCQAVPVAADAIPQRTEKPLPVASRPDSPRPGSPIPANAAVVSMSFFDYHESGPNSTRNISLEESIAVLETLRQAKPDERPKKWAVLGRLRISLKNDNPLLLDVYRTGDQVAFSLESRRYFSGGSEAKLLDALIAADTLQR
jgi:hypothetical protein